MESHFAAGELLSLFFWRAVLLCNDASDSATSRKRRAISVDRRNLRVWLTLSILLDSVKPPAHLVKVNANNYVCFCHRKGVVYVGTMTLSHITAMSMLLSRHHLTAFVGNRVTLLGHRRRGFTA
jgi:hypothetical protein